MTGHSPQRRLVIAVSVERRRRNSVRQVGSAGSMKSCIAWLIATSRRSPANTLQTTALAHEAYLRAGRCEECALGRTVPTCFAVAARMMRRILVDLARARDNLKRGDGAQQVSLGRVSVASPERGADMLALDEALQRAGTNPRQSQVVELRTLAD